MRLDEDFDGLGASSHGDDRPRSLVALAARLGVTYRTLMRWRKEGLRIVADATGAYSVAEVERWRRTRPSRPDPRTGSLFGRERRYRP